MYSYHDFDRLKVRDKTLYGGKNQKGIRKKSLKDGEDHTRDKDGFDGAAQSVESPSAKQRWRKRGRSKVKRDPSTAHRRNHAFQRDC